MEYRSIMVHVGSGRGSSERLAAACRIAAAIRAALCGVYLSSGYISPTGGVAADAAADALFAEQRRKLAADSKLAHALFERLTREAAIDASLSEINGDFDDEFTSYARLHDLLIAPRRMTTVTGDHAIWAERVAMRCGGPVLMLPEGGYPANFGRKILLAWKDGRESARVLRDAWPFLAAAEEVHILTVARDGECRLGPLLERQLARHGCRSARLLVDHTWDRPTGETISRHIDRVGADMAVIGLFGRSRFQEIIIGGVSQHLLEHPSMPLLMSH